MRIRAVAATVLVQVGVARSLAMAPTASAQIPADIAPPDLSGLGTGHGGLLNFGGNGGILGFGGNGGIGNLGGNGGIANIDGNGGFGNFGGNGGILNGGGDGGVGNFGACGGFFGVGGAGSTLFGQQGNNCVVPNPAPVPPPPLPTCLGGLTQGSIYTNVFGDSGTVICDGSTITLPGGTISGWYFYPTGSAPSFVCVTGAFWNPGAFTSSTGISGIMPACT